jgi:hypothetical protein
MSPTPEPSRWFGVGHSADPDPAAAGALAVAAATGGRDAALVLVFCEIDVDHPALLDAVRAGAGRGAVITGCSTNGQVVGLTPYRGKDGVVVIALGGPGFAVRTVVARDASTRRREAGVELAACVDGLDRPNLIGILLADGLIGEQHELVRGAYSVVGAAVPLVGGCAADGFRYARTVQFHGDDTGVEVLSDAVVGIGLGSDGPLGVGIAHGWRKAGEPMVVTRSSGGTVHELDDEPAVDAYLRRMGHGRDTLEDPSTFWRTAFNHPLGLSRRSGEDIRVIHVGDLTTGTLVCLADVPQGALAWVMESDPESLILGGKESVGHAVEALGDAAPIGVVQFNCGARRIRIGDDDLHREVAAMDAVLGGIPFGGFYTYGEIARTQGARGMHHLTVVSLALG